MLGEHTEDYYKTEFRFVKAEELTEPMTVPIPNSNKTKKYSYSIRHDSV